MSISRKISVGFAAHPTNDSYASKEVDVMPITTTIYAQVNAGQMKIV